MWIKVCNIQSVEETNEAVNPVRLQRLVMLLLLQLYDASPRSAP